MGRAEKTQQKNRLKWFERFMNKRGVSKFSLED